MIALKLINKYFLACLIIFSTFSDTLSQNKKVEILDEGLAINITKPRNRDIFAKDPLEYQLIANNWKTPFEGEAINVNGSQSTWCKIKAGNNGWFINNALKGGYAYVEYISEKEQIALLEGMAYSMVYVNDEPRIGNKYRTKDIQKAHHQSFNSSLIPVKLNKGKNTFLFYCMRGKFKAQLHLDAEGIYVINGDPTLPDLIVGEKPVTQGAIVVINATEKPIKNGEIIAAGACNIFSTTPIPIIQSLSSRKISFAINGDVPNIKGGIEINLQIKNEGKKITDAKTQVILRVLNPSDNHKRTFISNIDRSVQYYSVNPAQDTSETPKAMFFSLHGASAKAINQSGSYYPKSWGHVVSPTNRGTYGFDWEDWGRLDALEVYDIATKSLNIDMSRIYLTGHSMGGHGTFSIGAKYPDKFAAIGPSAGWISFWTYDIIPSILNPTPMEKMMLRAYLPINTDSLLSNYKQYGIYIIHGNADDDVPVTEAYAMTRSLKNFHKDFQFHEEPGAGHWWDRSDDKGVDCVDWKPLFDFFARHSRPTEKRILNIEFVTACPGVSAKSNWVTIEAQNKQLQLSKVNIQYEPGKNRFNGTTINVARLSLNTSIIDPDKKVIIELDNQKLECETQQSSNKIWLESFNGKWEVVREADPSLKGPHRYGRFKDAFRHNMIFVYGTNGNTEENRWAFNKARFDAEQFWYQGNGSVDVIPDSEFDSSSDLDRSVIIYGNANTNSIWNQLLDECPVQVLNKKIVVDGKTYYGSDLGCLFIVPRKNSDVASVGVVAGTGITGMKVTNRRPYLTAGYQFPDLMIFNKYFPQKGADAILTAGFFGLDWSVKNGEFEVRD